MINWPASPPFVACSTRGKSVNGPNRSRIDGRKNCPGWLGKRTRVQSPTPSQSAPGIRKGHQESRDADPAVYSGHEHLRDHRNQHNLCRALRSKAAARHKPIPACAAPFVFNATGNGTPIGKNGDRAASTLLFHDQFSDITCGDSMAAPGGAPALPPFHCLAMPQPAPVICMYGASRSFDHLPWPRDNIWLWREPFHHVFD